MKDNARLAMQINYVANALEMFAEPVEMLENLRSVARHIDRCDEPIPECLPHGRRIPWFRTLDDEIRSIVVKVVELGIGSVIRSRLGVEAPQVLEMFRIRGLTVKQLKDLREKAGVNSVASLERFLGNGGTIESIDETTAGHMLFQIRQYLRQRRCLLGSRAQRLVRTALEQFQFWSGARRAIVSGELRRCCDIIERAVFLLIQQEPEENLRSFIEQSSLNYNARQVSERMVEVDLGDQLPAKIHFVRPEEEAVALFVTTGSREHVRQVSQLLYGSDIRLEGFALRQGEERLPIRSEEEIYLLADLPLIPPEQRNGRDEVKRWRRSPDLRLVQREDLRGDLHSHSVFTDGRDSMEDLARAAVRQGHEYLAITDHTRNVRVAGGLHPEQIPAYLRAIKKVRTKFPRLNILSGLEVDILRDGTLDMPDEVLVQLDLVVASIHGDFDMATDAMMARLDRALSHPQVNILAHPTTRMMGQRTGLAISTEALLDLARDRNVALELNCNPRRLDLSDRWLPGAASRGIPISLSTDAHSCVQLSNLRYGICQARRGGLRPEDVLNTLDFDSLKARLA